jgi:hypothetical protein
MINKLVTIATLTLAAALLYANDAFASDVVPTTFTYQGVLKHAGNPVNDPVNLAFRLWDAESGGNQIGPELTLVGFTPDNGHITVDLDFGTGAFTGGSRWLEIWVGGAPLSPRQPLMAAPYAMVAGNVPPKAVVGNFGGITGVGTLDSLDVSGNVGIGLTNPNRPLHIRSIGAVGATPNSNASAVFERASDNYLQLLTPSANARGILFGEPANAAHGALIYNPSNVTNGFAFRTGGNTTRMVLTDTGRLGIGITDPDYPLHVSGRIFAESTSWVIRGHRTSQTGTFPAVWGLTESVASGTAGVRGDANHTSPGATAAGVYGHNFSTTANGYGVRGHHDGGGVGVYGEATSDMGTGVYGNATGNARFGVYGSAALSTGTHRYGVYGVASGITNKIAVFASNPDSSAFFGNGSMHITGFKNFEIDHPLDPENKTLRHYCTESPEPLNVYRGRAMLDEEGVAWIDLPDYFEAINRDPLYHLTAIGGAMPNLHIAREVEDNRFLIAGGAPGKSVSWRVEAVRNDLHARTHGAPVEIEKPEIDRGRYLTPELYGKPRELGIHYFPKPDFDSSATTDDDETTE